MKAGTRGQSHYVSAGSFSQKTQLLINGTVRQAKFKCLPLMGGPFKLWSPRIGPNPGCSPSCRDDSQDRRAQISQLRLGDVDRHKNS